jgi:hypothetical protein
MVRQVPAQFLVPCPSDGRFRLAHIAQSAPPFVFTTLHVSPPGTPFLSHAYKTLWGVTRHARSAFFLAACLFRPLPQFRQYAKSCIFSRLSPLVLSCLSFSISHLLESATCSLFSGNTGGWGRVSAQKTRRTRRVRTLRTPSEHVFWSRTGSADIRPVRSFAQRRRRLHIQLSLLQAQGFQVNG